MLREEINVRQFPGEPPRRWFYNNIFDLIVWYSADKDIIGFQLCYSIDTEQKALTWFKGAGFAHNRIDDGEGRIRRHKMSPVLVADGAFDRDNILALFEKASMGIDPSVAGFVLKTIEGCPAEEL